MYGGCNQPKRCILHDKITALGGAERVAFALAEMFDAPIFCMQKDESIIPNNIRVVELGGWVFERVMDTHYMLEDLYQMFEWQYQPEIYEYDTVIINKTNPAWFQKADNQTVVQYVHSPPRGLYDMFPETNGSFVTTIIKTVMRCLYETNRINANEYVTNSEVIQKRLRDYQDETSSVVYPPVDTDKYGGNETTGDYYLSLSRLEGHKRVFEIADICKEYNIPLKIAGDGNEYSRIQNHISSVDTIECLGYVSESRKIDLLANAKALIINAKNEDFGMTAIESFASGTPVIGVKDGFTQHQIADNKNGILYNSGCLAQAITHFENLGVSWDVKQIMQFSKQFDESIFKKKIRMIVEQAEKNAEINPGVNYE